MKNIYFFIFLIFLSCSTGNKVYICGNHECKNQKEIDYYFKNNISMEVYVIENDKLIKKNQDLVQLNLSKNKKIEKKKRDKLDFLNKRTEEINKKALKEKSQKLKLKVQTDNNQIDKIPKKKIDSLNQQRKFTYKKPKSAKIVHLCKSIDECDIDIISKRVNDLNKNKSYPDINF